MPGSPKRLMAWRDRYPIGFSLFAIQAAATAEDIYWYLKKLREPGVLPFTPPPPDIRWLSLYKSHRLMEDWIGSVMGFNGDEETSGTQLLRDMKRLDRLTADQLQKQKEEELSKVTADQWNLLHQGIWEFFKALADSQLEHINNPDMFSPEKLSRDENAAMKDMMSSPMGQFFFNIWLPLWIEHRCQPGEIYRLARQGDISALDTLLRLDKAVLLDRRILGHVHEAYHLKSRARFNRLAKAMSGSIIARISRGSVKGAIAALIMIRARQLKVKVQEPDLRELYDALAVANGKPSDRDITSPEAFAKSITRQKTSWTKSALGHITSRHLSK